MKLREALEGLGPEIQMAPSRGLGITLLCVGLGCSAGGEGQLFGQGGTAGTGGGVGGLMNIGGGGAAGIDVTINPPCGQIDDGVDRDGDGFTVKEGDCNDCSVQMNPGAYDYPSNGIDEDCNGKKDDEPTGCDQGLPLEGNDAKDAAKSLGLCKFADSDGRGWGVLSARWVFADGSTSSKKPDSSYNCTGNGGVGAPPNDQSHGLLPSFGGAVKPRDGASMVVLSSGVAREGVHGDSPGGAQMCTQSGTPKGYPTSSKEACPGVEIDDVPIANDSIALELEIRAPTNAKSISFDFDFYTYEFPTFVCSQYNDFFVGLLYSEHPTIPSDNNICFDAQKNPVSVNNGFLEVCVPQKAGESDKDFECKLGTDELQGTGFEDHAATGWLQTTASINPGEVFKIRFAIWDAGDEVLDSTVLIDNFKFDVSEGQTQTIRPPPK